MDRSRGQDSTAMVINLTTTNEGPGESDRFAGALLGMAIGDALAMPGDNGRDRAIATYESLLDASGEVQAHAGQFTAHTELALCLIEAIVSSNGFVDPDAAGYRFVQVLASENGHFLDPTTRTALERASSTADYQDGLPSDGPVEPGPAARVVPIALTHALGRLNTELLVREVMRATLITHADPLAVNGALALAYALNLVVRREIPPEMIVAEVLAFIDEDAVARALRIVDDALRHGDDGRDDQAVLARIGDTATIEGAVAAALYLFSVHHDDFQRAVLAAANVGPGASAVGAMTGALCGAWIGARAIPIPLVDGLDGRMYILMAAPALYRTAQRRAGLFLQLHQRP